MLLALFRVTCGAEVRHGQQRLRLGPARAAGFSRRGAETDASNAEE